ncbi:alpha-amylase family protein [Anditalea andensis]|uniref:Trehalose synthase n=1 Tax=Anditalea andensis TaxID=1048983 RepID=A0A074L3A3_9BACT|nr:alpha-amylase family protein [Anditalea andensis]KEO74358.1 trehalose synthase [Anditalea andensis]
MKKKISVHFTIIFLYVSTFFIYAQEKTEGQTYSPAAKEDLWYKNSIIYNLDVDSFYDADGDGIGDFSGLKEKLYYLKSLGIDAIWLSPFQKSPNRDNGYDIEDYYMVHPDYGTAGDMVAFFHLANALGIRIITDMVVNHTSNEHRWFQEAVKDKESKYRDYYVWSDERPDDWDKGMVFPGVQDKTWTYHPEAGAYYYHRFYEFQPDLNNRNPKVREEVDKILGYWLWMGVAGFRLDAVPFIIEDPYTGVEDPDLDFGMVSDFRKFMQWRRGDAIILGEANVEPGENKNYFGDDGEGMHMMFNFYVNQHLFHSMATSDKSSLEKALLDTQDIPQISQWAHFLRNHDELDLGRLTESQQHEVFAAYGPDEDMQVYERGIRRRLAPMLDNNRKNLEFAYSLIFSLPGTPVIRYGDEIGMGDNLNLPEREAVRTPMQWNDEKNGGFSIAEKPENPVIDEGLYSYDRVNVALQQQDPGSFLNWTANLIRIRKQCPEIGMAGWELIDTGSPHVMGIRYFSGKESLIVFHNFSEGIQKLKLQKKSFGEKHVSLFQNGVNFGTRGDFYHIDFEGYGYQWIRVIGGSY